MKSARCDLPIEYIRQRLHVDAEGVLRWSVPVPLRGGMRPAGERAGMRNRQGYLTVNIWYAGKAHKVLGHRIVWALTHGEWSHMVIDHINRDKSDDRPCNLRHVTHLENMRNVDGFREGRVGVYRTPSGKFRAQIHRSGFARHLGTFATEDEAIAAFQSAANQQPTPL